MSIPKEILGKAHKNSTATPKYLVMAIDPVSMENTNAYVMFKHIASRNLMLVGTKFRHRGVAETFMVANMGIDPEDLANPEKLYGMTFRYSFTRTTEEFYAMLNEMKANDIHITETLRAERLL